MFKHLKQNTYLFENQARCKLVIKNLNLLNTPDHITLATNLNRLTTYNDPIILETLYLVELLTNLKPAVTFYRKTYQEVSLQITTVLRKFNIFYFLLICKIFYFPLLKRRNETLSSSSDERGNSTVSLKMVNLLPVFPDLYYK